MTVSWAEMQARESRRIELALGSPLSTRAVSRELGCSASTVRNLIRGGFLDIVPGGCGPVRSHWRVTRGSLAKFRASFKRAV